MRLSLTHKRVDVCSPRLYINATKEKLRCHAIDVNLRSYVISMYIQLYGL